MCCRRPVMSLSWSSDQVAPQSEIPTSRRPSPLTPAGMWGNTWWVMCLYRTLKAGENLPEAMRAERDHIYCSWLNAVWHQLKGWIKKENKISHSLCVRCSPYRSNLSSSSDSTLKFPFPRLDGYGSVCQRSVLGLFRHSEHNPLNFSYNTTSVTVHHVIGLFPATACW